MKKRIRNFLLWVFDIDIQVLIDKIAIERVDYCFNDRHIYGTDQDHRLTLRGIEYRLRKMEDTISGMKYTIGQRNRDHTFVMRFSEEIPIMAQNICDLAGEISKIRRDLADYINNTADLFPRVAKLQEAVDLLRGGDGIIYNNDMIREMLEFQGGQIMQAPKQNQCMGQGYNCGCDPAKVKDTEPSSERVSSPVEDMMKIQGRILADNEDFPISDKRYMVISEDDHITIDGESYMVINANPASLLLRSFNGPLPDKIIQHYGHGFRYKHDSRPLRIDEDTLKEAVKAETYNPQDFTTYLFSVTISHKDKTVRVAINAPDKPGGDPEINTGLGTFMIEMSRTFMGWKVVRQALIDLINSTSTQVNFKDPYIFKIN